MIKVTVKENVLNEKGGYETKMRVEEHEKGEKASVFNGVLTIYTKEAIPNDFAQAVGGYEPSAWFSWKKV